LFGTYLEEKERI